MNERELPRIACPRCRKEADWYDNPFRPFCSERCKLLDLGAWAEGQYRIPGQALSNTEEDPGDVPEENTDEGPHL